MSSISIIYWPMPTIVVVVVLKLVVVTHIAPRVNCIILTVFSLTPHQHLFVDTVEIVSVVNEHFAEKGLSASSGVSVSGSSLVLVKAWTHTVGAMAQRINVNRCRRGIKHRH
jgi:hypothetical protein